MFESRKVNGNSRALMAITITKYCLLLTKPGQYACRCAGTHSPRSLGLVRQPGHQFRKGHENSDHDGHAHHKR